METAVASKRPQLRLLRRVGSVLLWAALLLLGAFGIVFSFANYPAFGTGIVLLILLLTGYGERKRRTTLRSRQAARRRQRPDI